jgi:hypothetical protein
VNGEGARGAARLTRWLMGLIVPFTVHLSPFTLSAQTLDDTLYSDSLDQDTVDYTARFLEAQEQVGVRVPMPVPGQAGPRPAPPGSCSTATHRVGTPARSATRCSRCRSLSWRAASLGGRSR